MTKEEILINALKEYEDKHYMEYGTSWQRNINKLIVEAEDRKKKNTSKPDDDTDKYKKYLYNAIVILLEEYYSAEDIVNEIGMSNDEYYEIMGESV